MEARAWTLRDRARARLLRIGWTLGVYLPPDRRVLERTIVRYYATEPGRERILFVGVKAYNVRTHAVFAARDYVTIDPEPSHRRYGARQHVVGRIEDLAEHVDRPFDVILMNAVIGYGLDDPVSVGRALAACRKGLRRDGDLVLGVNEERPGYVDVRQLDEYAAFEPFVFPPLGVDYLRVPSPFVQRSHSFLFLRRRHPTPEP